MTALGSILAFILGNKTILGFVAIVLGALGFGFQQRLAGAKAERNNQTAKEAKARAEEIDRIKRAAGAAPSIGVQSDPNNRDNQP